MRDTLVTGNLLNCDTNRVEADLAMTPDEQSTRGRDYPIAVHLALANMKGINRSGQEGLSVERVSQRRSVRDVSRQYLSALAAAFV
jgi:hypothetical protein